MSATPNRSDGRSAIPAGVCWDTGTDFGSVSTRADATPEQLAEEAGVIAGDLQCPSVLAYGTYLERLERAAAAAHEAGLAVWLQPRLIDAEPDDVLSHLIETARHAQRLRAAGVDVTMVLGCEWSVFTAGLVPGDTHAERAIHLARPRNWLGIAEINRRLNARLGQAARRVRDVFTGRLTYAAGLWEKVDWTPFDIVGLNLYRMRHNRIGYEWRLRRVVTRHRREHRPVVITEFGCAAFQGAARMGPMAHTVTDLAQPPDLTPPHLIRSEQEQAIAIGDQLAIFDRAGVERAFVFELIEPYKPYDQNPRRDLDMTGYAITATQPPQSGSRSPRWRPKAAFHTLARHNHGH
jgi:hypothetical protein